LGPGALLDEEEFTASVVDAGSTQEAEELQREGDLAIQVLMETVVPARFVVQ
jgi:hypothetical protein